MLDVYVYVQNVRSNTHCITTKYVYRAVNVYPDACMYTYLLICSCFHLLECAVLRVSLRFVFS